MLGKRLCKTCPSPSRLTAAPYRYKWNSRRITLAYAQQLTATQAAGIAGTASDGKSMLQVQVARTTLPCERPLPLANVLEVQRLLFLLEAPEYCMRAFREHGVNGQDLMHMQEEDLEDSRFKFPKNVQRKVMRIAEAWRVFQDISGNPTKRSISMEQYLSYYDSERSPDGLSQLQAAFRLVDANNNGNVTFEEFLVGYSLLETAVASTRMAEPNSTQSMAGVSVEAATTTSAAPLKWMTWLSPPRASP